MGFVSPNAYIGFAIHRQQDMDAVDAVVTQGSAPDYEPDYDMTESMVVAAQTEAVEVAVAAQALVKVAQAPAVAVAAPTKKRKTPEDDGIRRGLETVNGIWDIMVDVYNEKLSIKDFPWKVNDLLFSVAGLRAEPKRDAIWAKVDSMKIALQRIQEAGDNIKAVNEIIDQVENYIIDPSPFQAKKAKA